MRVYFLGLSFIFTFLFSIGLQAQKDITVEAIWQDYLFVSNSVPGFNFMNDGRHYLRLEDKAIIKYDITTGEPVGKIFDLASLDMAPIRSFQGYLLSPDESTILLYKDQESIYRRSTKAHYYMYDSDDEKLISLAEGKKISFPTFSPDGSTVAYVYQNNVYIYTIESGTELQVTYDGEYNKIINGMADWVYEEEFAFAKAFFWSPDSRKIAYYRFDETMVPEFTMTNYYDQTYPDYITFKYPKVGEKNSDVSIHIYDMEREKVVHVDSDPQLNEYIPRIQWSVDPDKLCVFFMNRHQNHLRLHLASAADGKTRQILEEKNMYYIDIHDNLRFLADGRHFLWTSEKSGYNHVYLHSLVGGETQQLTSGDWDITELYGLDEEYGHIYYQSAEQSPLERHVYRVNLDGTQKVCLTPGPGTHGISFSDTYDYGILEHSSANSFPTYKVINRAAETVRVLEDNSDANKLIEAYGNSVVEFIEVPGADSSTLHGYRILPPDFDESMEYPVLMYVYGGPGSQTVRNEYLGLNYWWFQMLAQQGYIVVSVDNRGTGARGQEFKKCTYQQLGKLETADQIAAAKYLAGLDYVDGERIGVFGWSYGGYMSSLCILKGNDVFKAAIAVAPVTNWKWYDTIYTERYMRTESENPSGYRDNSPIYFAERLEDSYLLVHGMGDDNVHFQNTVEMANALIAANKQFDTYFYPNRNHGIYGGTTRQHLYDKMTQFIHDNL